MILLANWPYENITRFIKFWKKKKLHKGVKKSLSIRTYEVDCYKTILIVEPKIFIIVPLFNRLISLQWLYLPLIINIYQFTWFLLKNIQFSSIKYFLFTSFYLFLELSTVFFRHLLLPKFNVCYHQCRNKVPLPAV